EEFPVGGDGERPYTSFMSLELFHLLAGLPVPDANDVVVVTLGGPVPPGRDEHRAIGGEYQGWERHLVCLEFVQLLAGCQAPKLDHARGRAVKGQGLAIRRNRQELLRVIC